MVYLNYILIINVYREFFFRLNKFIFKNTYHKTTLMHFAKVNSILRSQAHNEGYCATSDNARRRSKPRRSRDVAEAKPRPSRDESQARSVLRALSRVS